MEKAVSVEERSERPGFDLESFMMMSHESRIGGATLERLEQCWETWCESLNVRIVTIGSLSYLVVWLPKAVEDEIERVWKAQAQEGFLLNSLAQFLCMQSIGEFLPEVEEGGCAPAPRPSKELRATMEELGVPYKNDTSFLLSLQFAVVTHYPYQGGCEICHLQDHCPKGMGKAEEASVLLPGFEKPL
ncbi:MAG: hypothetical protein IJS54_00875 [Desulfovibrio sp.]|nr:hypothetical protein [Desulfovibrio sp.]